ncbi:SAC3 family protein A, partial [Durusdinium trenchii]
MVQTVMRLGHEGDPTASKVECHRRDARRERFDSTQATKGTAQPLVSNSAAVVGTSNALFRPFLRLRSAPDPAAVRPEEVLKASLSALLKESTQPSGGWGAVREQLWSIRQDLLVQHLHRSKLASEV